MAKRRFVVVDPSFTDAGGDRWQYAVTFAQSAKKNGYEFVLLANRRAPRIYRGWRRRERQRNVFPHAFYEHDRIVNESTERPTWKFRQRVGVRLRRMDDVHRRKLEQANHDKDVLRFAELTLRHSLKRGLWALLGLLALWCDNWRSRLRDDFNRDQFAATLARELRKLQLRKGDCLFFHTTTQAMMESLLEVSALLGVRKPSDVDAYFLFHFGAEAPDAKTFVNRYYGFAQPSMLMKRLAVGSPFARLHFLATNPKLAEELSEAFDCDVGRFDGLTNISQYLEAIGGDETRRNHRWRIHQELEKTGSVRIVARVADLDAGKALALSRAAHLVQHRGFSVDLRFIYTDMNSYKLREILSHTDFPFISLKDASSNDEYLQELAQATLVILPYDGLKYQKRVSATLHDCAVLAVPAVVPEGTTLADMGSVASVFVYSNFDDLLGTILNAVRSLRRNPQIAEKKAELARGLYASDVIQRLLQSMPVPSLSTEGAKGIANVVHPLWGRSGSTYAFDAQISLLLSHGYFVNQVLVSNEEFSSANSIRFLWGLLEENSLGARGCIQRVAFAREQEKKGALRYADALLQFVERTAKSAFQSPEIRGLVRNADVTIVNHIFNAEWAAQYCGGKKILDSHDIQSYAFAARGERNWNTGVQDSLTTMFASEMRLIKRFDHVVNCSTDEHRIIAEYNRNVALITPHVPQRRPVAKHTLPQLGRMHGWHEVYQNVAGFDLLIAGDSHPANISSALWFVREVFTPYLQKKSVSLALAGRLSDEIYRTLGGVEHVFYVGFVKDLDTIRALSRMAVLPDREGTGISIKTLEAFATGAPFVATKRALRGLPLPLPPGLRSYDEPQQMAEAILEALSNPETYASLSCLASQCYAQLSSEPVWQPKWESVIQSVLGRQ